MAPSQGCLGGSLEHSKMTSSSHFACRLPSSSPLFLLSAPSFLGPFFPYCSIKLCFIAAGEIAAGRHPMPMCSFFHSNRFPLGMPRVKAPFPISHTCLPQLWQHTLFWLKGSEDSSLILKGKGCDLLLPFLHPAAQTMGRASHFGDHLQGHQQRWQSKGWGHPGLRDLRLP